MVSRHVPRHSKFFYRKIWSVQDDETFNASTCCANRDCCQPRFATSTSDLLPVHEKKESNQLQLVVIIEVVVAIEESIGYIGHLLYDLVLDT